MDARLLNSYAGEVVFPIPGDATAPEMLDPAWRDLAMADSTTIVWIILPVVEIRGRRSPSPVVATGPSEASISPAVLDATEDRGDGMALLEIAAETGDEIAFVQAASEIDWPRRSAAEFARAVRLALAAGAHLLARTLAARGARLYTDHQELRKMARLLAPPRIVRADLPPDPSIQANRAWLQAHTNEYRGQWVALRSGQLLAVGSTAQELKAQLENIEGVLLARVL